MAVEAAATQVAMAVAAMHLAAPQRAPTRVVAAAMLAPALARHGTLTSGNQHVKTPTWARKRVPAWHLRAPPDTLRANLTRCAPASTACLQADAAAVATAAVVAAAVAAMAAIAVVAAVAVATAAVVAVAVAAVVVTERLPLHR